MKLKNFFGIFVLFILLFSLSIIAKDGKVKDDVNENIIDGKKVEFTHKTLSDQILTIETDQEHYACIGDSFTVGVTVNNSLYSDKDILKNKVTTFTPYFKDDKGRILEEKYKIENNTDANLTDGINTYYFDVPCDYSETKKFNISLDINGETFDLDPTVISVCNEIDNAILECSGIITTGEDLLDVSNVSVWMHDLNWRSTNGVGLHIYITGGWLNATNNVTLDGHGIFSGGLAKSGSIDIKVNQSTIFNDTIILGYGSEGDWNSGAGGGNCQISSNDTRFDNVKVECYGGSNSDQYGNACESANQGIILLENVTSIVDSNFTSRGGTTDLSCGTGIQNGGDGTFKITNREELGLQINTTSYHYIDTNSGDGTDNNPNSYMYLNVSSLEIETTNENFSIFSDSAGTSNANINIINLTSFKNVSLHSNGVSDANNIRFNSSNTSKLGVFTGTDFYNTFNVYCLSPNITIGNDTTLDPQLDFTNCQAYQDGNITYQTLNEFFNSAPTITTPTFPQIIVYNDTNIIASTNYSDTNGDVGNVTATWYVNDVEVHTESNSTVNTGEEVNFTLNQNNFTKGQEVNITMYASDSEFSSSNVTNNITVSDSTPTMTSVTFTPTTVDENTNIQAESTYADVDKDTANIQVNWTVSSVLKKTTTYSNQPTGTTIQDTLTSSNYVQGDTIVVTFEATNDLISSVSTDTIIVNTPPTIVSNTTIPNQSILNQNLIITTIISDADNSNIEWVNFTLIAPNGTTKIDNVNGSYEGVFTSTTEWNSSSFLIDAEGIWNWSFNISDGLDTVESAGYFDTLAPNFSIESPNRDYGINTSIEFTYLVYDTETIESCFYRIINTSDNAQELTSKTSLTCTKNTNNTIYFNSSYENQTLILNATDSFNNTNQTNVTFALIEDTTAPNITITNPTGDLSSFLTVPLYVNVTDTYLDSTSCVYRIETREGSELKSNTSIGCDVDTTFDLSSYGLRTIIVYALDDNNKATQEQNFSITQATTTTTTGGGGGGATPSTFVGDNIEFTLLSDSGSTFYQFTTNPDDTREANIIIDNKGKQVLGFQLECVGDICDWITLEETKIDIAENSIRKVKFKIDVPPNVDYKDYQAKIKGTYNGQIGFLNINVKVSSLGFLLKSYRIDVGDSGNALKIPFMLILAIIFILTFIISLAITTNQIKEKKDKYLVPVISLAVAFLSTGLAIFILP